MERGADVIIIGAGIIGASIAYHLISMDSQLSIVLVEAESVAGSGSTGTATGGFRHQFGTEANIRLSILSRPYFEHFKERFGIDPDFRRHGYLFLTAEPKRWQIMEHEAALQRKLGLPIDRLTPEEIHARYPFLRTTDLVGGNFCALDGSVDPSAILQGFLNKFLSQGGTLLTEAPVRGMRIRSKGSSPHWIIETAASILEAQSVVIAAGAYSHQVAALAGIDIPVFPYQRQVFVVERPSSIWSDIPLIVDRDTGWYVHAHSNSLLLGGTDKDERPGLEPVVDWDLVERVHAATVRRLPILENAKVMRAYAGIRALTPDDHPILGPVAGAPGLYLACGLGGHGVMHSPAVGLLIAEWILYGKPVTWDASCLSLDRFYTNQLIYETTSF